MALLFVSLREGYSKDITRITNSQWIKQTIHTCYQFSDMTDQQVTQVRAHAVRAMAASLTIKGAARCLLRAGLELLLLEVPQYLHKLLSEGYLLGEWQYFKAGSHCIYTTCSEQWRLNNIINFLFLGYVELDWTGLGL